MMLEKSYLMMIVIKSDQEKITIQFRTRESSLRGSNNAPSVLELIQAISSFSLTCYNFYPETVD